MNRAQLIEAIAKIICHGDGHIWLSKLDSHVPIKRQQIQNRYLNTAESVLKLIEAHEALFTKKPSEAMLAGLDELENTFRKSIDR